MPPAAPVVVQPDLEAWLWDRLSARRGVTSWAYAANQYWPGWAYAHSVQVDCRAGDKKHARDLAEDVRQLLCALPDEHWPDGVISFVQPTEGPFWAPDDDGCPRYVTRYEIRVHPRRGAAGTRRFPAWPAGPRHRRGSPQRRTAT